MSGLQANINEQAILRILRVQMTAVNQQFVHVLALRSWGMKDTADRIMEIDRIDFPLVMKTINYLISNDKKVALGGSLFSPGTCEATVLLAEKTLETQLRVVLRDGSAQSGFCRDLAAATNSPRQDYAHWLSARLAFLPLPTTPAPKHDEDFGGLFSLLLAMIEQSMIHAFVHWHADRPAHSDGCWASSGAAMMHATALVRCLAALGTLPCPSGEIGPTIAKHSSEAYDLDRQLALDCTTCARSTARHLRGDLQEKVISIASFAAEVSAWNVGEPHPARFSNPMPFRDFSQVFSRYVLP
jgi:hypothetical protein